MGYLIIYLVVAGTVSAFLDALLGVKKTGPAWGIIISDAIMILIGIGLVVLIISLGEM